MQFLKANIISKVAYKFASLSPLLLVILFLDPLSLVIYIYYYYFFKKASFYNNFANFINFVKASAS